MRILHVIKNTGFYTIALILPQIAGVFTMPIFTRFLTPKDYAIVALVATLSSVLSVAIALQIHSTVARFIIGFMAKGEKEKAKTFFNTILIFVGAFILILIIALEFFGEGLVKIIFSNPNLHYKPYFRLGVFSLAFASFYSVGLSLLKALQRAKTFLGISIVFLLSSIFLKLFLVVRQGWGVKGALFGEVIGAFIAVVVLFWIIREWLAFSFESAYIRPSLAYSIPLIPHSIANFLLITSSRIILARFVPLAAIGIFAVSNRFASVPLMLVNSFNLAHSPHFIDAAEKDQKAARLETKNLIGFWFVGILTVVLGFFFFSEDIVRLLTTKPFYSAAGIIPVLVLCSVFRGLYCFSINAVFFTKKTHIVSTATIVAGLVSLVLNFLLIPRWGIMGAAWAAVFAYATTFLMAFILANRHFPILYPWKKMAIVSILLALFYSGAFAITKLYNFILFGQWLVYGLAITGFVFSSLLIQDRNIFYKGMNIAKSRIKFVGKDKILNRT